MADVRIVRTKYVTIDGVTYKLIDEEVPDWAKKTTPDKTLKKDGEAADSAAVGMRMEALERLPYFFYDEEDRLTFDDRRED